VKGQGRYALFSIVFGVTYTVGFYSGWALFKYYPLVGQFHADILPKKSGPAMLWYAWVFDAALIAALVAFLIPRRWSDRLPAAASWITPLVLIVAMFVYERHWFV
jgi:hypothetical protein